MTHDKDPEIRFVTATLTYLSYFIMIVVRSPVTFRLGTHPIIDSNKFIFLRLVTFVTLVVQSPVRLATKVRRRKKVMLTCSSRGRVSSPDAYIIASKIVGTAH